MCAWIRLAVGIGKVGRNIPVVAWTIWSCSTCARIESSSDFFLREENKDQNADIRSQLHIERSSTSSFSRSANTPPKTNTNTARNPTFVFVFHETTRITMDFALLDFGATPQPGQHQGLLAAAASPGVFGDLFDTPPPPAAHPPAAHQTEAQARERLGQLFTVEGLRLEPGPWRAYKGSRGVLTAKEEELLKVERRRQRSCIYAERTRQKQRVLHQEETTQLQQVQAQLAAAQAEIARLTSELHQWRGY